MDWGSVWDRIWHHPVSTFAGIGVGVLQWVANSGQFTWGGLKQVIGPILIGALFKDK